MITERPTDLADDIRRSLVEPLYQQLALDLEGMEEERQFRRDMNAMRTRLGRIPEDIVAEHSHIDRRYSERTRFEFPVSVTFLVPDALR